MGRCPVSRLSICEAPSRAPTTNGAPPRAPVGICEALPRAPRDIYGALPRTPHRQVLYGAPPRTPLTGGAPPQTPVKGLFEKSPLTILKNFCPDTAI